jgi:hypothetical protein
MIIALGSHWDDSNPIRAAEGLIGEVTVFKNSLAIGQTGNISNTITATAAA